MSHETVQTKKNGNIHLRRTSTIDPKLLGFRGPDGNALYLMTVPTHEVQMSTANQNTAGPTDFIADWHYVRYDNHKLQPQWKGTLSRPASGSWTVVVTTPFTSTISKLYRAGRISKMTLTSSFAKSSPRRVCLHVRLSTLLLEMRRERDVDLRHIRENSMTNLMIWIVSRKQKYTRGISSSQVDGVMRNSLV